MIATIAATITLFFALFVRDVSTNNDLCPAGWVFSNETSYCYFISDDYMTYAETSSYCQSLGGSQMYIMLIPEFPFVEQFTVGQFAQPWLATTRNTTNNRWYNPDGTSPYSSWWSPSEPSVNGDCATFKSSTPNGLKATPCWNTQPAMCRQMPALCPTVINYGGQYVFNGSISSPGYPVQYYNNLDCWYIITSPPNTYITMQFDPYMCEETYDYVVVYDGPNSGYPLLGRTGIYRNPRSDFESSQNVVSFKFHTDNTITNRGWLLNWNAKSSLPPVIQTGYNGTFSSPNYPNNYDYYTEQMYYISVAEGFQINVTIDDFLTEQNYDVLEIYSDYSAPGVNITASLSGNSVAIWNWLSPRNHVTMRFRSDVSIQMRGFHGYWIMQ